MKSSKDRAIIAQVAFKGAVDLAIAGKIEVKSILDSKIHTQTKQVAVEVILLDWLQTNKLTLLISY